ncbi:Sterol 3-beta-glucosyltransferase [Hondaea fermentalgiana]|uniref:Sterol 3-beta-glucosyltransferase n=1 Tax=Hondaea fermentalgiana TaxID=2315210 RepID=A0A2R5GVD6_9STRA|nr:Sterol 3-beta-glucosyltransferase [Hondaea fermentalgiana]|eukprot:GBG32361.1 Sterol 3-beta-glucosyltransferase [Hondaea fermentalgiana]
MSDASLERRIKSYEKERNIWCVTELNLQDHNITPTRLMLRPVLEETEDLLKVVQLNHSKTPQRSRFEVHGLQRKHRLRHCALHIEKLEDFICISKSFEDQDLSAPLESIFSTAVHCAPTAAPAAGPSAKHEPAQRQRQRQREAPRQGKPCALLVTIGSRGDLNPFLALGEELTARGYHVRIATHAAFANVVQRYGFEFWKIAGDPKVLMELMSSSVSFSSPNFVVRNYTLFRAIMKGIFDDMYACVQTPPANAHFALIVANPVSHCGVHLAEYLRIPVFMLFTMPWTRSRDFPFPLYLSAANDKAAPSVFNPSSYGLFETATWFSIKDHVNHFRAKQLGLPAKAFYESEAASSNINVNGRKVPFLYCWSSLIIPKPRDWGCHIMISGYLMTKSDRLALLRSHNELSASHGPSKVDGFHTSPQLDAFLARARTLDDRGPLYIGFGSINAPEGEFRKLVACIIQALHRLACLRHVDGTSWGLPGARAVIFQCLHHANIVEQELANPRNMCTVPAHGDVLFDAFRPLLATAAPPPPPPASNLRKTQSASPRSGSVSIMQKLAQGFTTRAHTPTPASDASSQSQTQDESKDDPALRESHDETNIAMEPIHNDKATHPPSPPAQESLHEPYEDEDNDKQTPTNPSVITLQEAEAAWAALGSNTIVIQEARHSELFPQCSAIMHHGGAGTFMTSAYAGTAQIPVPFFGDQFLWASVVDRLKIGAAVPAARAKTRAMVLAIRKALASNTAARADQLGKDLRKELLHDETTGPRRAVDAIEAWMNHEHGGFDLDLYGSSSPLPAPAMAQFKSTTALLKPAASKYRGCTGPAFESVPSCQMQ